MFESANIMPFELEQEEDNHDFKVALRKRIFENTNIERLFIFQF